MLRQPVGQPAVLLYRDVFRTGSGINLERDKLLYAEHITQTVAQGFTALIECLSGDTAEHADISIDTTNATPEETAREIFDKISSKIAFGA